MSGLVEMDETYIGGSRSGKRGRGTEGKSLVLIAVECTQGGIGRIRHSPIVDATGETLKEATLNMVEPKSTIRTDGWEAYNILNKHGYLHLPFSHKRTQSGDATPLAHRVASLLKRWWLGTHQGAVSSEYLSYYLDEFTFRFNRRTSKYINFNLYKLNTYLLCFIIKKY